ncbi:hypothetical protein SAY87_022779 [Trapa incisa]|uniref:EF-hand domain-containing protein n=1 Tax=Trapa incisa TaxID=236973 RepID=A0AAN7Q582_9MYRT|nr:hypothetical protein SAY87_022779 [Trapa incisa]
MIPQTVIGALDIYTAPASSCPYLQTPAFGLLPPINPSCRSSGTLRSSQEMEELDLSSGSNTTGFFALSVLLDSFFNGHRIFSRENTLQESLSKFWSFLRPIHETVKPKLRHQPAVQEEVIISDSISAGSLNGEEVEMVMEALGFRCSDGGIRGAYGADEISRVVEENVGLEEVERAFQVFDGNRDGFIDAEDVQRVLCRLGFREAMELENCRRMIKAFDRNGNGKIDFQEFLILVEN